jgi:RNA polymerase sigma-70 factor (ECF subfamily)
VTLVRIPAPADTADTAVTSAETRRAVEALAALSEPQRRCVVLATIGGCTAREISESERIPIGTAKTRIRDGLRRVRVLLAEQEESHD